MKNIFLLLLFITSISVKSQTSFSGLLGKQPITLVMNNYGEGDVQAFYVYNKIDTPITINGNLKNGELTLFEKTNGKVTASLIFKTFNKEDAQINGEWISTDKSKTYKISLKKDFNIASGKKVEWEAYELLQPQTTKNNYFKTIITKVKDDYYARVAGVKIYEKKTDKLIQTIPLECQLWGLNSISVDDFNFDGLEDFSVFEASYAGPNTSHIYILKDANSKKYTISNFGGTSLEFDSASKIIYEENVCCAGRNRMNATYKVIDNEMVLVSRNCTEYDDEKEDYIYVFCGDPEISFSLNNGKQISLSRTNEYFLQYSVLNKKGEIEFTFPTDNKTSTTNYFVFDDDNENYSLTFTNKEAKYTIYQNKDEQQIGVLVKTDVKTYNLKGDFETLNGNLGMFKPVFPIVQSNQFVNIKFKSFDVLPNLDTILINSKDELGSFLFNTIQKEEIANLRDQIIELKVLPIKAVNKEKLNQFINSSITIYESKNLEKILYLDNTKYLIYTLYASYPKKLNEVMFDRFMAYPKEGGQKHLNYKEFEKVEFLEIDSDKLAVYIKYKVTLTNGSIYNFKLPLGIELLPNGDFKFCFVDGYH